MTTIGFIGLGHMGNPMVRNLKKHSHRIFVFDINQKAVQQLTSIGATPAMSIAELAKDSDIIFTMLQTGEQVKSVCMGKEGLFANAKPNTLFIDCSSIDVNTARELHQLAAEKKFAMVDAPVSGGVKGAENGTLTIMVGGTSKNFQRASPFLSCVGKNIIHAGDAGNGQVAKICNNMLLGISMIGVSEAFTLGEKLGLSPEKLFEISSQSSGQCWAMTSYCPVPGIVENVPSNNHYQAGFTAAMMLKDLKLSQEAAKTAKLTTKLGAEATACYEDFVEKDHGQMDFSGIITHLL